MGIGGHGGHGGLRSWRRRQRSVSVNDVLYGGGSTREGVREATTRLLASGAANPIVLCSVPEGRGAATTSEVQRARGRGPVDAHRGRDRTVCRECGP